jgi:GLUT4 regulating protein TUG.
MRLIIRYCLPWGNFSTQAIEIDPQADINQLLEKVSEKFGLPKNKQILKFKRDGITVSKCSFV